MSASLLPKARRVSSYIRRPSMGEVPSRLWSGIPRPDHASQEFTTIADTLDLAWDTANNAVFSEAEADYLMAQLEQLTTAVLED